MRNIQNRKFVVVDYRIDGGVGALGVGCWVYVICDEVGRRTCGVHAAARGGALPSSLLVSIPAGVKLLLNRVHV